MSRTWPRSRPAARSATSLSAASIRSFGNATLYTWTAGLERKFGNLTADASYVGTAAEKLPAIGFPNAYPGATPAFARYTTFDSAGNVMGGFGAEMVIVATSHSTYHALQTSLSGTMAHGGPGIQASYTWSKSIDNTSGVIGGGNNASENPFDYHPEKGPSSFDVTTSFGLSVAQDLHLDAQPFSASPAARSHPAGSCSASRPPHPARHSPSTPAFSKPAQVPTASTVPTRLPSRISPPRAKIARTTLARARTTQPSSPFPFTSPAAPARTRAASALWAATPSAGPRSTTSTSPSSKTRLSAERKSGAELVDLQFRAEFFNLFNIVNMGLPANILTGSGFGEISKTAGNSRQIQFSLKLIY